MSQNSQSDGSQKHFAAGRGLLAAAETLNYSMSEQRSNRQMGGLSSGVGGGGIMENQEGGGSQMLRRGGHFGNTVKLFASLGLSPSDMDALAEIPEEDISVETLPRILMQLKSRKGDCGERRAAMTSDAGYRGGGWEGRMGSSSVGSSRPSADFGFGSLQDSSQGFGLNFSGGRERPFSDLSDRGSYSGLTPSDPAFLQQRMGPPSNGKIQDFLGSMPNMFPQVCSLCDFDVHSAMEWSQHTNGLRHDENRRQLLNMYPDWDPGMSSGRSDGGLLCGPNMSEGLLGAAPMSSSQTAGEMSSSWAGGGGGTALSGKNPLPQNKNRQQSGTRST